MKKVVKFNNAHINLRKGLPIIILPIKDVCNDKCQFKRRFVNLNISIDKFRIYDIYLSKLLISKTKK